MTRRRPADDLTAVHKLGCAVYSSNWLMDVAGFALMHFVVLAALIC